MVAGLAETAAEDLADHLRLLGTDRHVVTEIEIRFLAQNRVSPIVSSAWPAGRPEDGLIRVDLVDDGGSGRLTTSVLRPGAARAGLSRDADAVSRAAEVLLDRGPQLGLGGLAGTHAIAQPHRGLDDQPGPRPSTSRPPATARDTSHSNQPQARGRCRE